MIERLTDTRGSPSWPASRHASRKTSICLRCWTWNGSPVSSALSVERIRCMPFSAVQRAVASDAAPHQMRSRRPGRVRLGAQQAGRVGEHRARVGLGEALALEHLEEDLGVAARHVGLVLALGGLVAEVAPAVDDLLR